MLIVLERAKSSILPNGNFREFFLWPGGNFAFSKREFPVALVQNVRTGQLIPDARSGNGEGAFTKFESVWLNA